MPPPISSASTLGSSASITASLSETFAPPSTTTYGGAGSVVRRRSLLTSPTISIKPQSRHISAFVMTSPVCSVMNFESWGRNDRRTAE